MKSARMGLAARQELRFLQRLPFIAYYSGEKPAGLSWQLVPAKASGGRACSQAAVLQVSLLNFTSGEVSHFPGSFGKQAWNPCLSRFCLHWWTGSQKRGSGVEVSLRICSEPSIAYRKPKEGRNSLLTAIAYFGHLLSLLNCILIIKIHLD